MSHESSRFRSAPAASDDPRLNVEQFGIKRGLLVLREGKSFFHFDDVWAAPPRYLIPMSELSDKPDLVVRARGYQLAVRAVAASTNERTVVPVVVPPGGVFGHSAFVDVGDSPDTFRLGTLGFLSTFPLDWCLRQFVGSNVSLFYLKNAPIPRILPWTYLVHSAFRLSCNHGGYAPLWTEQLGDVWREPTPKHTWPVLASDDARWAVRAAIDAVVADAYGLDREQYEHVLSAFSHKSYPKAPDLCLAAFDELKAIGLDAFTKKHDPYWDNPLNESLPKPVIDLPIPVEQGQAQPSLGPLFDGLDPLPAAEPAAPKPAPRNRRATGNGAYEAILRLLDERGLIVSVDAQQATGLDAAGVRPHLARLVEEGRAVTEGQRRGTKYRRIDG